MTNWSASRQVESYGKAVFAFFAILPLSAQGSMDREKLVLLGHSRLFVGCYMTYNDPAVDRGLTHTELGIPRYQREITRDCTELIKTLDHRVPVNRSDG